jgi:DNA-binding response OmpR family regulator
MIETSRRVLYIEDEPDIIELVRLILSQQGYQVDGASGGRAGLDAVHQAPPDLILLDLMMADMDGWEVYRLLQADAKTRTIPVIVITAKWEEFDRVRGLHVAQVDDYLQKPFSAKDLIGSIERVLERRENRLKAGN